MLTLGRLVLCWQVLLACVACSAFSVEVHAKLALRARGLSWHSGLVDEVEQILSMGPTTLPLCWHVFWDCQCFANVALALMPCKCTFWCDQIDLYNAVVPWNCCFRKHRRFSCARFDLDYGVEAGRFKKVEKIILICNICLIVFTGRDRKTSTLLLVFCVVLMCWNVQIGLLSKLDVSMNWCICLSGQLSLRASCCILDAYLFGGQTAEVGP